MENLGAPDANLVVKHTFLEYAGPDSDASALGDLMVTRCRANSDGAIEYSKINATSFKDSEAETEYGSEAAQNSNDGESSMNLPEEVAAMPENITQSSQLQGNAEAGSNLALYYCFPMVDNFAAHGQAWSYGQAYNQLTSYDPEAHWRQVCKDAKARPGKKQQGKKQRSRRGQGKRNKSTSQDAPDTSAVEQVPTTCDQNVTPIPVMAFVPVFAMPGATTWSYN